jgi:type II secretory pathway pseudopilin PulG
MKKQNTITPQTPCLTHKLALQPVQPPNSPSIATPSGAKEGKVSSSVNAFTRVELLVVIACIFIVGSVALPLLGDSREASSEAVCMNNLKRWGAAFLMYGEDNNDSVPEEGATIYTIWYPSNSNAWYNVCPRYIGEKSLLSRYWPVQADPPPPGPPDPVVPGRLDVFACPSARLPSPTYNTLSHTYFMYGENGRLCINLSTRNSGGIAQTTFSSVVKPADTIAMGEVNGKTSPSDPLSTASPSQSSVTGQYSIARHGGRGLTGGTGQFAMCDGSTRSAPYRDFYRNGFESNEVSYEWGTAPNFIPRKIYWYPTPTTPD